MNSHTQGFRVRFDGTPLGIDEICALADSQAGVELSTEPAFRENIEAGAAFLDRTILERGGIYGVTTGYGDSCGKVVSPERLYQLPIHLTRFHGCGLGRHFDPSTTRAIMAVRLASLCQGYSGVSYGLLEKLSLFINQDVLPLIPEEGSVGASGDLTPLSYVAGALIGERDVLFRGRTMGSAQAMEELKVAPHRLRPKEALAIMNGTAVMTAIACLAWRRAEYLARLCCRLTAMTSLALEGNSYHFDQHLFAVKPHSGQIQAATWIREDLGLHAEEGVIPHRLQDPYSIRCAPHVIGVCLDALPFLKTTIENELNSANDNPIIDWKNSSILHGGHFYGGHIAFAMDSLKNLVANLADLMDRQLEVLVDEKYSRGLPPNLSGSQVDFAHNHGFKAVQIGVSAWTAEALKLTMPASVFSRSTECHNQDKVSMGTIAARDCIRVLELSEQVAAAMVLAASQALRLRIRDHGLTREKLGVMAATLDKAGSLSPLVTEDRPLESELRAVVESIRQREWGLADGE